MSRVQFQLGTYWAYAGLAAADKGTCTNAAFYLNSAILKTLFMTLFSVGSVKKLKKPQTQNQTTLNKTTKQTNEKYPQNPNK